MPESVLGERRGASEAGSGPRIKTKGGPASASRESPARAKPEDGGLGEEKGREEVVDQRVLSRTWEKSKLGARCSWEQNHRSMTWDTGGRVQKSRLEHVGFWPQHPRLRALSVASLSRWLVLGVGEARPCRAQLEVKGLAGGRGG